MENIKSIVAKNLQELRKASGMTQAELAEKLNYSDKSVSKWEHAESLPDIEVLCRLAELYGVTVDYLTKEGSAEEKADLILNKEDKKTYANKIVVSALFITSVWLIATMVFVYVKISQEKDLWMAFLWAVPTSFLVMFGANKRWGRAKHSYWIASAFLWTLILALCLQFMDYGIWAIIIIGIPLQVAIILISKIRRR